MKTQPRCAVVTATPSWGIPAKATATARLLRLALRCIVNKAPLTLKGKIQDLSGATASTSAVNRAATVVRATSARFKHHLRWFATRVAIRQLAQEIGAERVTVVGRFSMTGPASQPVAQMVTVGSARYVTAKAPGRAGDGAGRIVDLWRSA